MQQGGIWHLGNIEPSVAGKSHTIRDVYKSEVKVALFVWKKVLKIPIPPQYKNKHKNKLNA